MKKFLFTLVWSSSILFAQAQNVGIGNNNPDNSSVLDITSTSEGVLIPRMTKSQIAGITSPATSLLVYQTDGVEGFYFNDGTPVAPVWKRIGDEAEFSGALKQYYAPQTTTFTVPAGVYRLNFEMVGGGGGSGGTYVNGNSSFGGGGGGGSGFASGYLTVSPGEVLTVIVGDRGLNGTNGSPSATVGDGTSGSFSKISSGPLTLIEVSGGVQGLKGTSTVSGKGGSGGSIVSIDISRTKLSCSTWISLAGSNGSSGNSFFNLRGDGGAVHTMGDYNRFHLYLTGVAGGGVSNIIKPYYGVGAGYSNSAIWGYVIFYW